MLEEIQENQPFHEIAQFYDELMAGVPYRMWTGYYLLLLSSIDAHPKNILEVGCGTGILTEMLHEEDMRMSGIDLSAPMIYEAQAKAEKKGYAINYHVGNASTFELNQTFDGVLSFFDSLNNLTNPQSLLEAFKRIRSHIIPGGSFIFDLNTAYAFSEKMFDQQNLRKNAKLRYKWIGEWNEETKVITVNMHFWRDEKEFVEVHHQRAYEEGEVREMLSLAGFETVKAFHSYSLEKPRRTSDRIHYVALNPA